MRLHSFLLVFSICSFAHAQTPGSATMGGVLDGAFVPRSNRTKQLLPYPPLDESHVLYVKRIERQIPLYEKLNHPLFFPLEEISDRQSLLQLIQSTLKDGSSVVSAYRTSEFKAESRIPRDSAKFLITEYEYYREPLTKEEEQYEQETGDTIQMKLKATYENSDIIAFRIKEDWIFDKHRSQWYCRIIGVAPVMTYMTYNREQQKDIQVQTPAFWLYFPEWRHVFQHGYASAGTFNPYNDTGRPTFLELFEDRRFSSYIVKESNVYDRSISSYAQGEDALLESERIKNELFTMEHDLWHY
jgi:gliding motility associated protien GldN